MPQLSTQNVKRITHESAEANGAIDNDGGDCDERGFVYDTSSYSDPGDVSPALSNYGDVENETGIFNSKPFVLNLSGLSQDTTYYLCSYAHNTAGYDYGPEVSFATNLPNSFSRSVRSSLPADDADLDVVYSSLEANYLDSTDTNLVGQQGGGTGHYLIQQYKRTVTASFATIKVTFQTGLTTTTSTVYFQLFNRSTGNWETIDTESSEVADTDFVLKDIKSDLSDYQNVNDIICFRVYQQII
jgi:hypothetical protein